MHFGGLTGLRLGHVCPGRSLLLIEILISDLYDNVIVCIKNLYEISEIFTIASML